MASGCDHLDPKTFDSSMQTIVDKYMDICHIYSKELVTAMGNLYRGWQSTKGVKKINTLQNSLCSLFNGTGTVLSQNYDIMKTGGVEYAREQEVNISIAEFNAKKFEYDPREFSEGQEIIIDRDVLSDAATLLERANKELKEAIGDAQLVTKSDQAFGYYSTGDVNPRVSMNDCLSALGESFGTALTNFTNEFSEALEADEAAAAAIKKKSVVDKFTDILG